MTQSNSSRFLTWPDGLLETPAEFAPAAGAGATALNADERVAGASLVVVDFEAVDAYGVAAVFVRYGADFVKRCHPLPF